MKSDPTHMFDTGDRVVTPRGNRGMVTALRVTEKRGPEAHVRFNDSLRVPGWFAESDLIKEGK